MMGPGGLTWFKSRVRHWDVQTDAADPSLTGLLLVLFVDLCAYTRPAHFTVGRPFLSPPTCPDCGSSMGFVSANGPVCWLPSCSDHFLLPTSYYVSRQDRLMIERLVEVFNPSKSVVTISMDDLRRLLEFHEHLWRLAIMFNDLKGD